MNLLTLAIRNILRHRKRSTVTIITICLGFTALGVIGGLVDHIYSRLKGQAVVVEKLGHLTFAREGFFANGKTDPAAYLWEGEDLDRVLALLRADERVALATPRLSLFGIASNGEASTIFITEAIVPDDDRRLITTTIDGELRDNGVMTLPTAPERRTDVAVAGELAGSLGLEVGDYFTLLTSTKDGMANAIDVDVGQIWNTGNPAINDKFILSNFALSQELYDTRGAQRVVVTLHDETIIPEVRADLLATFAAAGLAVEARPWNERSLYYEKIRTTFGAVFGVLVIIITIVVVLTLLNTMQMAVAERMREIGTLRAIGLRQRQVVALFCTEGVIMGVVACLLALPVLFLISGALLLLNVTFVPPIASAPVPIALFLRPSPLLLVFGLFCLAALLSSYLASRRISRQRIVDSLTKAI